MLEWTLIIWLQASTIVLSGYTKDGCTRARDIADANAPGAIVSCVPILLQKSGMTGHGGWSSS
jgi:hypothetical protein